MASSACSQAAGPVAKVLDVVPAYAPALGMPVYQILTVDGKSVDHTKDSIGGVPYVPVPPGAHALGLKQLSPKGGAGQTFTIQVDVEGNAFYGIPTTAEGPSLRKLDGKG